MGGRSKVGKTSKVRDDSGGVSQQCEVSEGSKVRGQSKVSKLSKVRDVNVVVSQQSEVREG